MKNIFLFLSLVFSLSTIAQVYTGDSPSDSNRPSGNRPNGGVIVGGATTTGSDVVITPVWPTTCEERELKNFLNTVYDVHKIDENDEKVTFSFYTQLVQCNQGRLLPYSLEGQYPTAAVVSKKFVLFHSRGIPMTTTYELSRPDEVKITVTFFKKRIFKNARETGKEFSMLFQPFSTSNYPYRWAAPTWRMTYWWNVWLIQDVNSREFSMKITQGKPQ